MLPLYVTVKHLYTTPENHKHSKFQEHENLEIQLTHENT